MISDKYKCIFIHVPKTAGTSISNKLGHFENLDKQPRPQDHRSIREIEPLSLIDFAKMGMKGDLRALIRRFKNLIKGRRPASQQQYATYYKFAFVRNSWSRVFSWYKGVMRDVVLRKSLGVSATCSFREFLEKHLDQHGLNPQLYWLTNGDGKVAMDFIGRYENLTEDFSHVCNKLGIEGKTLQHLIRGNNEYYTQFYDEETKNIVAKKYASEIAYFGFQFEK